MENRMDGPESGRPVKKPLTSYEATGWTVAVTVRTEGEGGSEKHPGHTIHLLASLCLSWIECTRYGLCEGRNCLSALLYPQYPNGA